MAAVYNRFRECRCSVMMRDLVALPVDDGFMHKLHDAYDGAPWQAI